MAHVYDLSAATWALIPLYGIDNKLAMARVVVQLLNQTVGVNGKQRSPCLGLDGNQSRIYPRRLIFTWFFKEPSQHSCSHSFYFLYFFLTEFPFTYQVCVDCLAFDGVARAYSWH